MENSFFEYRDVNGTDDSDAEIIDDSIVLDPFKISKTKSAQKNQTVYIAESEDSQSEDISDEDVPKQRSLKSVTQRSSAVGSTVLSNIDDEASRRSSIRSQSDGSNGMVVSSSDEGEMSPEIVRWRPTKTPRKSSGSFVNHQTRKRIFMIDSDTDNSIVFEHNKNTKHACLKDTPAKINTKALSLEKVCDNSEFSDSSDQEEINTDDGDNKVNDNDRSKTIDLKPKVTCKKVSSVAGDTSNEIEQSSDEARSSVRSSEDNCDDFDEDQMVMSRATRMSIMGFVPKDNESDESDFIQSDDNSSRPSSASGYTDLPEVDVTNVTPNVYDEEENEHKENNGKHIKEIHNEEKENLNIENHKEDSDNSRLTCSPFTSPLKDITNEFNTSLKIDDKRGSNKVDDAVCDLTQNYDCDTSLKIDDKRGSNKVDDAVCDLTQNYERDTSLKIDDKRGSNNVDEAVCDLTQTYDCDTSLKIDEKRGSNKVDDAVCDLTQNYERDTSLKIDDKRGSNKFEDGVCDLTQNDSFHVYDLTGKKRNSLRSKIMNNIGNQTKLKERVIDDDVTIIVPQPEVIALSSDDDEDVKQEKKSPRVKKSPAKQSSEPPKVSSDMKQFLLPPSYPNRVVYVTKQVRESELNKLQGLQQDLLNVRNLLENMDVDTLPDGGAKLVERLTALEQDVRRQGDKVASLLVEPDNPTAEDIAKDGFANEDKGLSWDDLQKASNAVQPRMFGKQAMATHMAERNLILDRLRDLHAALASRPPESELATAPPALRTPLMPHQLHALAWLKWRETQRPHGGILADDMGLGKTITMIALIASDKEAETDDDEDDNDDGPGGRITTRLIRGGTLVVCPASLMQQWAEEVTRHCQPHRLSVCLHHGTQRATQPQRLATQDVVLTTYNILLREAEKKGPLCRVRWRRTILDEAHAVRNHKSATAGAVLPSVLLARRRWALTGTPLHNKDLDLFALLRYLGCSPFDDLTMWKKWIDNKSLGGQERLSTIMRCIMLRRTKVQLQERGQLACLPSRDQHEVDVKLTKEEMNVYQKLLVFSKTLFAQFLHQRAEKRADAQGTLPPGKDSAYAEMHKKMVKLQGAKPVKSHEILVLLLRLRQVCCHCGLIGSMLSDDDSIAEELDVDSAENDLLDELNKLVLEDKKSSKRKSGGHKEEKEEEGAEEGSTAAEAIRSVLSRKNPVFQLDRSSSKIKAVMQCLQEKVFSNPGEKAVVVSQWAGVLRLVEKELSRAKISCVMLTGAVPVNARPPLVAALNNAASPVKVMLLSLTAGGVGLNLCGANHLLLLDPHWNPQLEQQAQDRVYRVGQARPVHIYRFMCVDTVEATIRQLQRVKLEMADNVLTGARNINASKLSIEDLKMLFNMGQ